MQDNTLKALHPNNAPVNGIPQSIEGILPKKFTPQRPLPDTPSIAMFEESLRERLEAFALDAQEALGYSMQTDIETLQECLELQMNQLRHLINEVRLLHWLSSMNKEQ